MSFLFFATGIILWMAATLGLGVLLHNLELPLIPAFFVMLCVVVGGGLLAQEGLVRLARHWNLW